MLNKNELKGEFVKLGFTQEEIANRLGITPNGLRSKLTGKTEFKLNEIQTLIKLGIPEKVFLK